MITQNTKSEPVCEFWHGTGFAAPEKNFRSVTGFSVEAIQQKGRFAHLIIDASAPP